MSDIPESDIDLANLSRCYGLSFRNCDIVVPGVQRTYRLVAEARTYYLRLYRPVGRSPAEIAFELRLLREVPPTPGIDVARPIRTAEGAECARITFAGVTRTACLFQALDGRTVAYEPDDMALFGAALAKLHNALAGIEGGDARRLDPQMLCERAIASLAAIPRSEAARQAIDLCRMEILRDPAPHDLPSGNCHGDAWPANTLIRNGTVGFLDFEDCGHGPYLLDLGTAVWHLVTRPPSRAGPAISALLAGYETARALTEAERLALPRFVKLAEIRGLLFLATFCTLEDGLWSHVLERAVNLLDRELKL